MRGKVFLVGAGPGDPGLLTLRAAELLETADVVVYDRLVSEAILDRVAAGVARIPVGKSSGRHSVPQDETNRLLATLAQAARRVVRLKGGDPFVFGRGGEEALYLQERGIAFEVVPGITAAVACAAYAGIPLTHRGMSHGFRVVTGHLRDDGELELDWRALADPDCTLVVYMGLATVDKICIRLVAAGLPSSTPAAAVQSGTTDAQRRFVGTLGSLPSLVRNHRLRPPALLVIGATVALASRLDWFEAGREEQDYEEQDHGQLAVWSAG